MVYNKYLNFMEKKYKSKIKTINFRNKDNGWLNYNIEIEFINKKSITEKGVDNLYMKGFLMNLYGRPSCTNCQFKNFTASNFPEKGSNGPSFGCCIKRFGAVREKSAPQRSLND